MMKDTNTGRTCRVLVVGAGLSGCVAAWMLRRKIGHDVDIEVWDGARGCGGRLATQRITVDGEGEVRMNMGAQRLHFVDSSNTPQEELIQFLEKTGVVQIYRAVDTRRGTMLPVGASNEVCRQMLVDADAKTRYRSRIRSIDVKKDGSGFVVAVFGEKKVKEQFDAIIFAGSPAEVKTTHGDMSRLTRPMWSQLTGRFQHTRNCCLGLVFRDPIVVAQVRRCFSQQGASVISINDEKGLIEELEHQPSNMAHTVLQQGEGLKSTDHTLATTQALAIILATSTEKFADHECRDLRATHRPTPHDKEQQRKITDCLLQRTCQLLATRMTASSDANFSSSAVNKAVVTHKMNFWKYSQAINRRDSRSQRNNASNCFVANTGTSPFVVVGDYFPGSHESQPQDAKKACGFTAVVRSADEATREVTAALAGAMKIAKPLM